MLLQMAIFHSFLWLSSIPSIDESIGCFIPWQLQIMLLWTQMRVSFCIVGFFLKYIFFFQIHATFLLHKCSKEGQMGLDENKGEKHDVSAALLAPLFCWEQLHLSPVWEFQKHLQSHTQNAQIIIPNVQTLHDPVKLTHKINNQSVYRRDQPWWLGRKNFWTHQTPLMNTPKSQLCTTTMDEKGRNSPEKTYN